MTEYEDIIRKDMDVALNYDIYDSALDRNISIVDFMDDLIFASQKDMVRSSNPLTNILGYIKIRTRLPNTIILIDCWQKLAPKCVVDRFVYVT